ncbi:MAG TPA: efflux RND transporter periplasmic adaptor subunit [Polyangiaceae bacterium]|nr:efflux RND transporter periplasmic adaptor subunit [Polyangiaceae bacterium]
MRYVLVILGLVVLVGALAGVKALQIGSLIKMGEQMEKSGPPPEVVAAATAQEQSWEGTLSAIGSVSGAKGVAVSNDAAGVVSAIRFESGAVVKAGQVLVELESGVERAQLASALARKELAEVNLRRSRTLLESNTIAPAQVDSDEAQLKTLTADVGALQAQIARKVVRAPFAGKLGIRSINLGQFLAPGTTITTLEAMESVFVDFSLPQQRLGDVAVGAPVRVTLEKEGATFEGTVSAIEPGIEAATRTVKLRASVPSAHDKLRPGMFAQVEVVLPRQPQAKTVVVPATAVVHAPYGDSVFVLEEPKGDAPPPMPGAPAGPRKVARQQFVKLGPARGDFVAVVDGVKPGQEVVSAGAFKLRNNAPVVINNAAAPAPQLTPRPANS